MKSKLKKEASISFMINRPKIPGMIKKEAKRTNSIIYGSRAMNRQMRYGFMERKANDFDVMTRHPKKTANIMQRKFDKEITNGVDDFYVKEAEHKGTFKVMYDGFDGKRRTKDDFSIVDYSSIRRVKTRKLSGNRYETMKSIEKGKRKTLKDPESKYRHKKDREDLKLIRANRSLRRILR